MTGEEGTVNEGGGGQPDRAGTTQCHTINHGIPLTTFQIGHNFNPKNRVWHVCSYISGLYNQTAQ